LERTLKIVADVPLKLRAEPGARPFSEDLDRDADLAGCRRELGDRNVTRLPSRIEAIIWRRLPVES